MFGVGMGAVKQDSAMGNISNEPRGDPAYNTLHHL